MSSSAITSCTCPTVDSLSHTCHIYTLTYRGKSICYQLPALVAGGSAVTIVVCPLIALMIDQVNNLHRKGVMTAAYLSSSQSSKTKQEILNRLQADNANKGTKKNQPNNGTPHTPINILYCTPELIQTDRFRTILTNLYRSDRLHMVAVDEAHCLSTVSKGSSLAVYYHAQELTLMTLLTVGT